MKKVLFFVVAGLFTLTATYAQNSSAEIEQIYEETKAEKFLRECHFYRTDTYIEMEESGIRAWAKVATNLETNQKIGFCYFMTESKMAGAIAASITASAVTGKSVTFEGTPSRPLGYLDMDEIDDMITALNKIVELTKEHNPNKYTVSYITKSGIDIFYDNEENKVIYSKVWHYVNEYGVKGSYRISSPNATIKAVTKTITMLEKAKFIINHNLNSQNNDNYEVEIIGDEDLQPQQQVYNTLYININPKWAPEVKRIAEKYNKTYEFKPKYDLNEDGILSADEVEFINYIYSDPAKMTNEDVLFDMAHKDYNTAMKLIGKGTK